jgi:prephenate dehydratase
MTKIESRPIHGKPFEYQFYLDFEFDPLKLEVAEKAIDDIMRKSNRVKVLGMFKAGVIAV